MFCPNCGSNLPEGLAYCSECGTPLPVAAPAKKKSFLSPVKLAILILTVVCIGAMIASYFVTMNTSIEDIAIFSILPKEVLSGVDEAKEDLGKTVERAELEYEKRQDQIDDDYEELIEDTLGVAEDLTDSFSLNNFKKAIQQLEKVEEEVDTEELQRIGILGSDDMGVLRQAERVINVISNVILYFMLFCLAFCAFGGVFRINGLVITGMILSILYALPFCGLLFTLVFLGIDISMIVLISKARHE